METRGAKVFANNVSRAALKELLQSGVGGYDAAASETTVVDYDRRLAALAEVSSDIPCVSSFGGQSEAVLLSDPGAHVVITATVGRGFSIIGGDSAVHGPFAAHRSSRICGFHR